MNAEEVGEKKLPWIYRFVLKLPEPSLNGSSETFRGLFYVVILPVFVCLTSFGSFAMLIAFPRPLNFVVVGAFLSAVLAICARILLERRANALNALIRKPMEWDVNKALQGYYELLNRKKADRSTQNPGNK